MAFSGSPDPGARICTGCGQSDGASHGYQCGQCGFTEEHHAFQNDSSGQSSWPVDLLQGRADANVPPEEYSFFSRRSGAFESGELHSAYVPSNNNILSHIDYSNDIYSGFAGSFDPRPREIPDREFLSPNTYLHDPLPPFPSIYSDTPAPYSDTLYCPYEGCTLRFTGDHRRGTVQRHIRLKHAGEEERRYSCQVEGCGKNYRRQDALLKHQRSKHPELGLPPPRSRKQESLAGPSQMEARQQLPSSDPANDERITFASSVNSPLEPPARDNDSNGEDDTLLDLRLPSNVHQYQHHGQDDEVAVALSRTGYIAPVPSSNTVSSSETRTWSVEMILYNMGLLEPPLHPNKIRLRWSSKGGDMMFSDVEEITEGGVAELVDHMKRSSGVKVTASPYRQYPGNQQYIVPRPDRWLRNGIAKATSAFANSKLSPSLPQHIAPCAPAVGAMSSQNLPQQHVLYLMACMHRDSVRKYVRQDRIENVTTDRELLCFMRQRHVHRHRSILRLLSLKRVKGIYFVKFWLPVSGRIDVRYHNHCTDSCDCIPPPAKVEPSATAEYRCSPIPPKTRPPISPEYLSMLFYSPSEAADNDTWVLNQLPKRTCGQLQGAPGQPAEGWGIYYHESWDRELITLAVFIILVLATLLFGVLWSKYQFDVQGAFGVSAWAATLGGILITLLVPQFEKIG